MSWGEGKRQRPACSEGREERVIGSGRTLSLKVTFTLNINSKLLAISRGVIVPGFKGHQDTNTGYSRIVESAIYFFSVMGKWSYETRSFVHTKSHRC